MEESLADRASKTGDRTERQERGQYEDETEPAQLKRNRTFSDLHELRQKSQKEQNHLRVGKVHDDSANVHLERHGCGNTGRRDVAGERIRAVPGACSLFVISGIRNMERLPCQEQEIGGADQLEHDKCAEADAANTTASPEATSAV